MSEPVVVRAWPGPAPVACEPVEDGTEDTDDIEDTDDADDQAPAGASRE